MSLTICEQCGRKLTSLDEVEKAVCNQCSDYSSWDDDYDEGYQELNFNEDYYYDNG